MRDQIVNFRLCGSLWSLVAYSFCFLTPFKKCKNHSLLMGYAIGHIWPVGRSLMTRVLFYEYTITYIYFVSSLQSCALTINTAELVIVHLLVHMSIHSLGVF